MAHTPNHATKKLSAGPMRTQVIAKVMLEDIKKPITTEKIKSGRFIIPQS